LKIIKDWSTFDGCEDDEISNKDSQKIEKIMNDRALNGVKYYVLCHMVWLYC